VPCFGVVVQEPHQAVRPRQPVDLPGQEVARLAAPHDDQAPGRRPAVAGVADADDLHEPAIEEPQARHPQGEHEPLDEDHRVGHVGKLGEAPEQEGEHEAGGGGDHQQPQDVVHSRVAPPAVGKAQDPGRQEAQAARAPRWVGITSRYSAGTARSNRAP
jgi:hypothetical protein